MNKTIEDRMDSIEQQLKELRKEMEESIARYNDYGKSYPFTHGDISKFRSGQIGLSCHTWDNIILEDPTGE